MKTDLMRDKYVRLMTEIEDLEENIDTMEKKGAKKSDKKADKELVQMKDELAAKRNELARISDGCGKPHAH